MLPEEIDALDSNAFGHLLADNLAVDRKDIYENGIGTPSAFQAAVPMGTTAVLERLGLSQSALVALLLSGKLVRPGKLGHGKVAWRTDEIDTLVPQDEREKPQGRLI